jgi:hypothetical protein
MKEYYSKGEVTKDNKNPAPFDYEVFYLYHTDNNNNDIGVCMHCDKELRQHKTGHPCIEAEEDYK